MRRQKVEGEVGRSLERTQKFFLLRPDVETSAVKVARSLVYQPKGNNLRKFSFPLKIKGAKRQKKESSSFLSFLQIQWSPLIPVNC